MTDNSPSTSIVDEVAKAVKLALENPTYFTQVQETILSIAMGQPLANNSIQLACINFIHKAYFFEKIPLNVQLDNCFAVVPYLEKILLSALENPLPIGPHPNYTVTERAIWCFSKVYPLVFYKMATTPDNALFSRVLQLREMLVGQLPGSFPLPAINNQVMYYESIGCQTALIKFIGRVICTESPAPATQVAPLSPITSISQINLNHTDPSHPFKNNNSFSISSASTLVDRLAHYLSLDLLLPTQIFSTAVSTLTALSRSRPQLVNSHFFVPILAYESQFKLAPYGYIYKGKGKAEVSQSDAEAEAQAEHIQTIQNRLSSKFNDRIDKCSMNQLKNQLPTNLKSRFDKKLRYMNEMALKLRHESITSKQPLKIFGEVTEDENGSGNDNNDIDNEHPLRKKRKMLQEDFFNTAKIPAALSYKNIWELTEPDNKVASFDVSSLNTQVLTAMVVLGLNNCNLNKLIKGMDIVNERWDWAVKHVVPGESTNASAPSTVEAAASALAGDTVTVTSSGSGSGSMPGPSSVPTQANVKPEPSITEENDDYDPLGQTTQTSSSSSAAATATATATVTTNNIVEKLNSKFQLPPPPTLTAEQQGQYLNVIIDNLMVNPNPNMTLLIRLATRGGVNQVRDKLFQFIITDWKGNLGDLVSWLSEEWFVAQQDQEQQQEQPIKLENTITADYYTHYATSIMKHILTTIDISDRQPFIRLLSSLPNLKNILPQLKTLLLDPMRFKVGFQSLLFLIMFRPPVRNDIKLLLTDVGAEAQKREWVEVKSEVESLLKRL
ncbi:RNA-processing protein [Martiniozyma asiatica (nom. inval.)]|nr:RNA-processing protein [Martiniozyma asiatica]